VAPPDDPADEPADDPEDEPVDEPAAGPELEPGDAEALAEQAANDWALGMGGTLEGPLSCAADGPSLAYCEAPLAFELNPGNVQPCSLPIAVVATQGRTGPYEHPASPYGGGGIEQEDFELPSGGLGTYEIGDSSECEQALNDSGY